MSKLIEMKRFILVLLILVLSLGVGVYSAYANEPGEAAESNTIISGSGSWQNPLIPRTEEQPDTRHTILSTGETAEATNLTELKSAIQQGFIQRQTAFSIHYTGDTSNLEADTAQIIDEIFADDDYLQYSGTGYKWGYNGYVNDVTISFTASYVSTREQEDYVEQQVPIILDQIINQEMSTLKKVKAINDYIVLHTKYSDTTSDPGISPHSAYALLQEGQGVCQGYALLAYKMLQQTGIPVRIIVGNAGGGGHAWNLVQINNQWYHMDVTWNDPTPNRPGQVRYSYFLRNNTISNDHSWDTSSYPETTDNSFAYFHVMSDSCSQGDYIYYSNQDDDNHLYRSKMDGTEQQKFNNNRSYYITVAGNWIYYSNYSYGGYLYKIRTDGSGESVVVQEHAINTYVKDNILYYTHVVSDTTRIDKSIPLTLATYSIATIANPLEGGTVSGASSYLEGDTVTLTATANKGYTFTKWTENGIEVSTNTNYTFTVNGDRNLTAEFQMLFSNATLSSIEIDANSITGFSPTTETYSIELPYATTTVPEITAITTNTKASIVVTPAVALPGTTTIKVTAEDGVTTKTYTINFTMAAAPKNTDATLSDLKVDGTTVTGFATSTLTYNVVLAVGTTTVPTVTAEVTDTDKASAVITPAPSLPGSTTVNITAEDGVSTKTYTINFTVAKNSDATLSDLKVDGTTVIGFAPSTLTYNIVLAVGTTTVPTVTAEVTDTDKASAVITPAPSLPGSTTVKVTAEDGVTTKTYTINFTVAKNSDATLSDLTVDGTTVTGFAPSTLTYNIVLAVGTTTVPTVTAAVTDTDKASAVITQATSLPGSTEVLVTAEDGVITRTYTINFTLAKNTDATLKSIQVNGSDLNGFSSTTETYSIELPYATTTVPEITAITTNTKASIVITPAVALPGTTTIKVTAEDGITTKTYTINFTVAKNNDATLSDLKVDGTTVTGFASSTLTYNIVLAVGTTTVPNVTAEFTDTDKASAVITPAPSLPGSTTVLVTAEDGVTTKTYTINFTVAKNSDATLSDLKVDGTTVTGFAPSTLTYNIVLAAGTTTVPTVTAAVTDTDKASAVIMPAPSLPGSTTVLVTAEDGITTKTYTINFTVAKNNDTTAKAIMVDGAELTGFSPATENYSIELPYGTTAIPIVTATPNDTNATVVITPALELPGTTQVKITAKDGVTTKTYMIIFTVAAAPQNTDATLSDLKVDGTTVTGFAPSTLTYNIVLVVGTTTVPTVTVEVTDTDKASAVITASPSLPGSTTVLVTAEDGTTTKTYTISFTVATQDETPQASALVDLSIKEGSDDTGQELISYFNTNNLNYSIQVAQETEFVTISATPATNTTVEIHFDDIEVTDGIIPLIEGINTINVVVSETDKADRVYVITIQRGIVDECFIATAAFDSKFTWPVVLLRDFRDQYLLTNSLGQEFVRFYYQNSPPIAIIISSNQKLKTMVRVLLAPLVASVFLLYHPTILLLIIVMVILITSRFKYRRYSIGN